MLTLYILAATIGGFLVLLSAIGGHGGDVHGGELHADASTDAGGHHGDASSDHGEAGELWLSLFGMRFWTYFAAAFGLTGLALSGLTSVAALLILAAAAGTGVVAGLGVSTTARALSRSQPSSAISGSDLIGADGTVLVAIREGQPGKIRCSLRGELVDLSATAERPLPIGAEVIVVSLDGRHAQVIHKSAALSGAEGGS